MATLTAKHNGSPAVVVGLCSHGLATVRALAAHNVEVHAMESDRSLPGVHTRQAKVHLVSAIAGCELVRNLVSLAPTLNSQSKPVLFLMSDDMVLEVAKYWNHLEPLYCLSWAGNINVVSKLLYKSELESHCRTRGLHYPKSWIIKDAATLDAIRDHLRFPLIVKPVKPLGGFKARKPDTIQEIEVLMDKYRSNLPFLLQQYIAGEDTKLFFCALYLDKGRILRRFDGRKIMSHPRALGQTLIAEPVVDNEVYEHTVRFFSGLDLSGPVSLEVKKDNNNSIWVIEPTLGRTDFWLSACVANGVNLPYIEYCHMTDTSLPMSKQKTAIRWFDTEKDPTCFIRYALPRELFKEWRSSVFPYWQPRDMHPFLVSLGRVLQGVGTAWLNSRKRSTWTRPRKDPVLPE